MEEIRGNINTEEPGISGSVIVRSFQIPVKLDSLEDVDITSPAEGQILIYDGEGWVNGDYTAPEIGNLSDLTTTAKSNLVAAINEVDADISGKASSSDVGTLSDLTTTAKNNLVAAVNEVDADLSGKASSSDLGTLSELTTTAKNNLVAAVNEVDADLSGKASSSDLGDISTLTTTVKTSAVAAINEITGDIGDMSDLPEGTDNITGAIEKLNTDLASNVDWLKPKEIYNTTLIRGVHLMSDGAFRDMDDFVTTNTPLNVIANKPYKIDYVSSKTVIITIICYDASDTFLSYVTAENGIFTPPSNCAKIHLNFWAKGIVYTDVTINSVKLNAKSNVQLTEEVADSGWITLTTNTDVKYRKIGKTVFVHYEPKSITLEARKWLPKAYLPEGYRPSSVNIYNSAFTNSNIPVMFNVSCSDGSICFHCATAGTYTAGFDISYSI